MSLFHPCSVFAARWFVSRPNLQKAPAKAHITARIQLLHMADKEERINGSITCADTKCPPCINATCIGKNSGKTPSVSNIVIAYAQSDTRLL